MPATYVSDAVLLQDVADSLTSTGNTSELPPKWPRIVADANQQAVADLTMLLIGKGYTQAQIDAWDDRAQCNRRLGVYHALMLGNPLGSYPDKFLENLNPLKMLAEAGVIRIAGVPTAPVIGASEVGGIEYGVVVDRRTELEAEACRKGWFS